MRRFQTSSMGSKQSSKSYEMVGRSNVHSQPHSSYSKTRLVKLAAAAIFAILAVTALHSVLTPRNYVYGVMIDAGSTGSRIHTYTFQRHPTTGKLDVLHEDFFPIKPGLSSYKDDPAAAAASLKPLMDRARAKVPSADRLSTPVVLRATAGLRMTGAETAESILNEVRQYLKGSGFRFDNDSWASILAGNEEGIYSWMTVNYLLGREPRNTVGTLEMGGGSAQVAYVPHEQNIRAKSMNCSTQSEGLNYKGERVGLYTVSHLDFGLQKARALAMGKFEETGKLGDNPCINNGSPVTVKIPFDESGKQLTFTGSGDYARCRKLIDETLTHPAMGSCSCEVCTYHGAAQPHPIPEYVAIAFYLERTVALGMETPLTVRDIREKGEKICGLNVEQVKSEYPEVPNGDATELCFDLAFITLHLERGHGIDESIGTKLMIMDKIGDFELGWCLGAMQETMAKLGGGK